MGERLLDLLQQYGYAGLAVGVFLESMGLPVPGETALIAAAFAAARGLLSLPVVIGVAALAGVLGDNMGYFLGRRLGREWLEKHGKWVLLNADRLERMDQFFERFGAPAIALARFILGVRVVAAFAAGVSRLHWATFLTFNVIGAVAWALVMGLIGFFAARGATALGAHSWVVGAVVAGGVILVSLGAVVFHKLRAPVHRFLRDSWIGRRLGHRLWVIATSVAAVLIFAKVAEDVATKDSGAFDGAIRDWVLVHRVPFLDGVLEGATYIGSVWVAVPLAAMAALLLWRRTHRVRQAVVLFAPLLGSAFFLALKLLFHRAYPVSEPAGPGLVYSFPSGHATTVAALATTIAYVLTREGLVRWKIALPAALAVVLLAGLGRIYLDFNWATDVIGGWLVGLFVAMLAAALYEQLRSGPPPRGQRDDH